MDPTLLSTLISLAVSIVTVVLHKSLTTPNAPAVPGSPSPSAAAPAAEPFAGIPGHPVLSLIIPWLGGLAAGSNTVNRSVAAQNAQNQAAVTALAHLIQTDPAAQLQMQAFFSAPAIAKAG